IAAQSENTENAQNSKRNFVQMHLDSVTNNHVAYDMATAGICMGDSGGPVLRATPAGEVVVGVHSFVQGGCTGRGGRGRVSTVGATFVAEQFEKPSPSNDCNLCSSMASSGKNPCAVMATACLLNPDCKAFNHCIAGQRTMADCAVEFPLGEGPFRAASACTCNRACTA